MVSNKDAEKPGMMVHAHLQVLGGDSRWMIQWRAVGLFRWWIQSVCALWEDSALSDSSNDVLGRLSYAKNVFFVKSDLRLTKD